MNTQDNNEINIGIDTGQAMLDIYVRPKIILRAFERLFGLFENSSLIECLLRQPVDSKWHSFVLRTM